MTRKTNQLGVNLIKSFEGYSHVAYRDSVGVWTIGFGHTRGVKPGQTTTLAQATEFLQQDLASAEQDVELNVKVPLTDNQFASLVSFVFNLGGKNFKSSTLLRRLNKGDYNIGNEFGKWSRAGGKVLQGLVRRRQAERGLWQTPDGANG